MFMELGEYTLISIGFFINICKNYEILALSETTLLCLCFTCCSLLTYTSQEFSNAYLYRHRNPGIMYSLILPITHILINFKTSHESNQIQNFFHIGCILFSFLPAIFELLHYKITSDNLNALSYLASLSFILIFAYWFVLLLHKIDLLSFIFICFLLSIHIYFLMSIPQWLPGSFTFGELVVLCQSFTYFLFLTLSTFLSIRVHSGIRISNQYVTDYNMTIFIYVLVASTALFLILLSHIEWLRRDAYKFYVLFFFISFSFSIPLLYIWMSENVWKWLLEFILQSRHSILLLFLWSVSCLVAVAIVIHYSNNVDDNDEDNINNNNISANNINNNNLMNNNNNNNNVVMNFNNINNNNINNNIEVENKRLQMSRVRKLFHLLMLLVFIPSYYLNNQLLCLATVLAFVLFLLLEAIRILDIPPLGGPMRKHLRIFIDEQDSGFVIVTPIYLLIGCSAPLWVSIGRNLPPLLGFAGVISIGIGDTVASWVGSKYGKLHWKDSRKTIEGTIASIITQLIATYAILFFEDQEQTAHVRVLCAVVMTALMEAFTCQIDNLVLPIFMLFSLL